MPDSASPLSEERLLARKLAALLDARGLWPHTDKEREEMLYIVEHEVSLSLRPRPPSPVAAADRKLADALLANSVGWNSAELHQFSNGALVRRIGITHPLKACRAAREAESNKSGEADAHEEARPASAWPVRS